MAVRKAIQIGHPALKAKNRPITNFKSKSAKQLIRDLKDTMRKQELIGMAAPQIAKNYKIFVTEPRKTEARTIDQTDKLRFYINPKITYFSKQQNLIYEACGSVINGKLFGPVKRPKKIVVEAHDENGNKFQPTCDGLLARVIQHEYDHLFGIEFTEKIHDYKKLMNTSFYKKYVRNSKDQKKASKITINKHKKL